MIFILHVIFQFFVKDALINNEHNMCIHTDRIIQCFNRWIQLIRSYIYFL